jgi:hypothetical protein
MTTGEKAWGVKLSGHAFDLEDWRDALKSFDPWVVHEGDDFILRSSDFGSCVSVEEVRNSAIALIEVLNGAMKAAKRAGPVSCGSVYEFSPDGRVQSHVLLEPVPIQVRVKIGTATLGVEDGGVAGPPPPPSPSDVQVWVKLSASSDHLGDALVYVGRGGWFDIYKAIECLEDWAGGQSDLERRGWVELDELRLMKRTANSHRHRAGGVIPPPPKQISLERAMELLAKLIECAFAEAAAGTTPPSRLPGSTTTEA